MVPSDLLIVAEADMEASFRLMTGLKQRLNGFQDCCNLNLDVQGSPAPDTMRIHVAGEWRVGPVSQLSCRNYVLMGCEKYWYELWMSSLPNVQEGMLCYERQLKMFMDERVPL
jgi:hypothetical protein